MRAIYKYTLQPDIVLELHQGSVLLSIREQHQQPQAWFLCNTSRPKVKRRFVSFGTGHEIPADMHLEPVGSFHLGGGALVFHVFETPYKEENSDTK